MHYIILDFNHIGYLFTILTYFPESSLRQKILRYLLKVLLDSLCMKLHYVNDPACCLHSTLQLAQCGLILVCLLNVNRQYNCPPWSLLGIVLRMEYKACLSYSLSKFRILRCFIDIFPVYSSFVVKNLSV